MIRIEIHNTNASDIPFLKAFGDALIMVAEGNWGEIVPGADGNTARAHKHIARDDRPDTGAPAASEVFGKVVSFKNIEVADPDLNPAAIFGGNAAPAIAGAATSTTAHAGMPGTSTSAIVPPPPAAPPAPLAPHAAVQPANLADLDRAGMPWDGRIHSESRAKISDGTWRRRRNLTDEYVAQIEAELRAVMGNVRPATAAAPLPPAHSVPVPDTTNTTGVDTPVAASDTALSNVAPPPPAIAATVAQPLPSGVPAPAITATVASPSEVGNVAPPPPPPTQPAASPSASDGVSQVSAQFVKEFPALCKKIAEAVNTGLLKNETLTAALAKHNLPNLPTLAAFPHLVPAVAEALGFTE